MAPKKGSVKSKAAAAPKAVAIGTPPAPTPAKPLEEVTEARPERLSQAMFPEPTDQSKPRQANSDADGKLIELQTAIQAAEARTTKAEGQATIAAEAVAASQAAGKAAEQRAKTAEAAAAAAESKIQELTQSCNDEQKRASAAASEIARVQRALADAEAAYQKTLAKLASERSSEKEVADQAAARSRKEVAQLREQAATRTDEKYEEALIELKKTQNQLEEAKSKQSIWTCCVGR